MSRIDEIREAVDSDSGINLEDAYADRAWLLSQYDALLIEYEILIKGHMLNSPHLNGQAAEQLPSNWRNRLGR